MGATAQPLNVNPTVAAFGQLGQSNAQRRAKRDAQRAALFRTAGALGGLAISGGNPLGATIGSEVGGALAGQAPNVPALAQQFATQQAGAQRQEQIAALQESFTPTQQDDLGVEGTAVTQPTIDRPRVAAALAPFNQAGAAQVALGGGQEAGRTRLLTSPEVAQAGLAPGTTAQVGPQGRTTVVQGPPKQTTTKGQFDIKEVERDGKRVFISIDKAKGTQVGQPIPIGDATKKEVTELTKFKFQSENTLRDDFRSDSKEFQALNTSFAKIDAAAGGERTPAKDISLIFNYMKMLDPTSVVREGEQATAANAAAVPDIVQDMYNRVIGGQRLTPAQRIDFRDRAGEILDSQRPIQAGIESFYRKNAVSLGLNPENVIVPFDAPRTDRGIQVPAKIPAGGMKTKRGDTITEGDIQQTMKDNNMTREQVIGTLRQKGIL